jgi:hypothetical protein
MVQIQKKSNSKLLNIRKLIKFKIVHIQNWFKLKNGSNLKMVQIQKLFKSENSSNSKNFNFKILQIRNYSNSKIVQI